MRLLGRLLFAVFVSFSIVTLVNAQTTDTTQRGNNTGGIKNGKIYRNDTNRTGTNQNPDATGGAVRTPSPSTPANLPAPSSAASAVQQASNNFMQAINRGDAAAAAGFYTDDAIIMPPDIDMIQGSNGIKNFWAKVISVGGKFDTLTTAKVEVNNQTVDEVGRYFLTIAAPGQATPSQEKGKFVFVWKLQPDDTWKITTHIWNRNRQ